MFEFNEYPTDINMSGLNNLSTRLNYHGGRTAESRFQKDKLRSLKKALLYSYQSETAILSDGREFRCLINSDRTKADYDCKIISIPFEDICIGKIVDGVEKRYEPDSKTSEKIEKIGLKPGDVFKWKERDSYWITYLELGEDSYFRAEIYKCEEEIEINGKKYHVYIRGPVETTIQWNQKKDLTWNDINYSLIIYITKNEDTVDYFYRFKKIKISGKTWEVKTVDPYSADGIIEVCLGEWFENKIEEAAAFEQKEKDENKTKNDKECYIKGPSIVYPFDIKEYKIDGLKGGEWKIENNKKAIIKNVKNNCVIIEIVTGKSGKFNLTYETLDQSISLPIEIKSI